MDALLNAIHQQPDNAIRLWFLEELASIIDDDVQTERVRVMVDVWALVSKAQKQMIVQVLRRQHLYYSGACSIPPLLVRTPEQAVLSVLMSPRIDCEYLKMCGVYKLASASDCPPLPAA